MAWALFILCGDILLKEDAALWWQWVRRKKNNKSRQHEEERESLSTCGTAQCTVLKTAKEGIFLKWAKSRLTRPPRQRDESRTERRKWGLRRRQLKICLLLTGSQPGETPFKTDVGTAEGGGVVGGGCVCRQLFPTRSSNFTGSWYGALGISKQTSSVYLNAHILLFVSARPRRHAYSEMKLGVSPQRAKRRKVWFLWCLWWWWLIYRQGPWRVRSV